MLLAVLRLLCLSLCSEAVASQLHWQKTKTTFTPHYESTATDRNVQSRRWRALSGEDNGLTRGASAQAAAGTWLDTVEPSSGGVEPLVRAAAQHTARKSDAPAGAPRVRPSGAGEEALRTDGNGAGEPQEGGRGRVKPSEGDVQQLNRRARTCHPNRTGHSRRRRDAKHGRKDERETRQGAAAGAALPEAMAQEGEPATAPPFNQTGDYEDFTLPDLSDSTPFVPMNTRTRRKQVKNPFYPLTAESYGAYAVMLTAAVIFAVGIIGNIAIMCIVCHNYYMRSISNSLLANLALWDFVVIFFCLPLVVFHDLTKDWLLGEFSCRIIPYLE
uniref:uncharacterized protein n=1 Tax=Centroberyx gerrardi TaxID=166262 RepID=UPI003AADE042